jgi:hypothetical protein
VGSTLSQWPKYLPSFSATWPKDDTQAINRHFLKQMARVNICDFNLFDGYDDPLSDFELFDTTYQAKFLEPLFHIGFLQHQPYQKETQDDRLRRDVS